MGQRIGDWEIDKSLDEGGQGWTYLAHKSDESEIKPVVLKVLKQRTKPDRLARFGREIEIGLRLSHPNVLKIKDHDINHDKPYFVTEFCRGGALGDANISELSVVEKLKLFSAICRGVGHAHNQGVIHRDLKPHNIFLQDNLLTPVVGDFGLCLLLEEEERLTRTTEVIGARWYLAPEMEDGRYEEAKPVADVYSLGKILYWMLAGRIFSREKHRTAEYDLTKSQNDPAILFVYELLDGMIVGEPSERRFVDANAVADAVDHVIRRLEMHGNPVDLKAPKICKFCGVGYYQKIMHASGDNPEKFDGAKYNLGMELYNIPAHTWLFLACDYCGNVQVFRPDCAKDKKYLGISVN